MNSEKKSGKLWEKIESSRNLVENAFELSKRDLKTAGDLFKDKNYDWAFSISYNAMLQAGRALMFSHGFRPKGEYKHVSVIEFVKKEFGKEFSDKILFMFDKIRKKRHMAVYEQSRIISAEESENSIKIAKEFVNRVKDILNQSSLR